MDRLIRYTHRLQGVTEYEYDTRDRIIRVVAPNEVVTEYDYDVLARVTEERSPDRGPLRYEYDLVDNVIAIREGRGIVMRHRYDANGNIVDRNGSYERNRYAYDALDRLDSERIEEEATIGYIYDRNGNCLNITQVEEDSMRYDYIAGSNRLLASEERRGPKAVPFAPRADRRLEYNDAGRLWRLYEGEGADKPLRAGYIYNGMGQRTRKIVHEAEGCRRTTIYHYDLQGRVLTETDAAGTVLRDYLWTHEQPVAQLDKQAGQERITYLYPDHLMTTRLGMDETGTVVWRWEGEAFGQSGAEQDPDGDGREVLMRLRFPGQYHDTESDLYYNWNRYYDPSTGRYIQSDLIGLRGGLNTYAYALGNPIVYSDPVGLFIIISINRTSATDISVHGTIFVYSTVTGETFSGYTLENLNPPNKNLPVPAGTYEAYERKDRVPLRIQLENVPFATGVQIHIANTVFKDNGELALKGCFAPGTDFAKDRVDKSGDAIEKITEIINNDKANNKPGEKQKIRVRVQGVPSSLSSWQSE